MKYCAKFYHTHLALKSMCNNEESAKIDTCKIFMLTKTVHASIYMKAVNVKWIYK